MEKREHIRLDDLRVLEPKAPKRTGKRQEYYVSVSGEQFATGSTTIMMDYRIKDVGLNLYFLMTFVFR